MKRKKFSEIISEEDRNEFLQYLMEKELDKIRKKIYKYKKCEVNWFPFTIEEKIFEDNLTAGRYIWDEKDEVHKIYIASRLLNRYLRPTFYRKKYAKEFLIDTIGHELTHGLVQEKFEHRFSSLKEKNRDGSPIFLATLQYFGYNIDGHHCGYNYIGSKVWKDIDELKKNNSSWSEFKDYIFFYLANIDSVREKFNREHQLLGQTIDFRFSSRGSGLRKATQSTGIFLAYIKNKKKLIHRVCSANPNFN